MVRIVIIFALLACAGCARDQAVAAANIRDLAARIPEAGPVVAAQVDLLDGIEAEAVAIVRTTEPDAQSTTAPMPTPRAAANEARRHAATVRTIGAQTIGDAAGWLDGMAGSILPMLGGGGLLAAAGWLLGKRAASPVLAAALRFGQMAVDRLAVEKPEAADQVLQAAKSDQEARGVREKVRKAMKAHAK
jgi:hypothetical protein